MSSVYETRIKELNLLLPPAPKPVGSYHPVVIHGQTAYLSGQISKKADGSILKGKVGRDLSLEDGKKAAEAAALNILSIIQNLISFDAFDRILRIVGYVQCEAPFYDAHQVMNGASDLFIAVLGDQGVHARSALGMSSLPLNAAVEIEATLALKKKL